MSDALTNQPNSNLFDEKNERRLEFIESIAKGEITTLDEASRKFGLPLPTIVALMSDPRMVQALRGVTQAKANIVFHTQAVPRLVEIVQDEDSRTALAGIKLLGELSNNLKADKAGVEVNVNLNLESLLKADDKEPYIDVHPHG